MPSVESTYTIIETCVCLQIQSASRAVAKHIDNVFRPLNLTNWQFAMLLTLHRAAPITVGFLAERLAMDRSTATANLKPLERRDLVKSNADEADGRARLVALTVAGDAVLADAVGLWAAAGDRVTQGLSDTDLHALCRTLRRISMNSLPARCSPNK